MPSAKYYHSKQYQKKREEYKRLKRVQPYPDGTFRAKIMVAIPWRNGTKVRIRIGGKEFCHFVPELKAPEKKLATLQN